MTKKMQKALNVSDNILILAGYVWCGTCRAWIWRKDLENASRRHSPVH